MSKKGRKLCQFEPLLFASFLLFSFISSCFSLNDEGKALLKLRETVEGDPYGALEGWREEEGVADPCSWFGVECSDGGTVVILDLRDLCLGGTLAPEIGNLVHLKSIVLRNNSFTGIIPKGIGMLKELELLDLGYNNFIGPLPPDLGNNLSLMILLVDNNWLLGGVSPEIHQLMVHSEVQVDEKQLSNPAKGLSCIERSASWNIASTKNAVQKPKFQMALTSSSKPLPTSLNSRDLRSINGVSAPPPPHAAKMSGGSKEPAIQNSSSPRANTSVPAPSPELNKSAPLSAPLSAPASTPRANTSVPAPSPELNKSAPLSAPLSAPASAPAPDHSIMSSSSINVSTSSPNSLPSNSPKSSKNNVAIIAGVVGGALFVVIVAICTYLCTTNKGTVKPWATGLSGQLQKAFVTGVPKLKRSEIEASCEDFSNVIGPSPIGTLYKGTLSNGIEIAVASVPVTSAKDWSETMEAQFRKKIEKLSKVNHKNFVNLVGYCEEKEPFTRMLVFEYTPNGTLFEHLHYKESEHLDWQMRLRIAMGIAYCLEHVHQLNPPVTHNNLNSSAVYLTEDYAAKISEFGFSNEFIAAEMEASSNKFPSQSDVYSFGVLLFEMITGRLPYSVASDSLEDWASDYLRGHQPLREMVDPTLDSYDKEKLEQIGEVIRTCVHPDPKFRPAMREVAAKLKEITGITHDASIPKLSPLWWAELEIMSADGS